MSYLYRKSKNDGLLYYDITDGFGPEIYVLGAAPRGEYRITAVLYNKNSLDQKPIKATVTLLRNAGTPSETREVFHLEFSPEVGDRPEKEVTRFTLQ